MDIVRYLDRIKYTGNISHDLHTLRGLHHHHVFQVPFEALDVYYGIPILLNQSHLFHKIIDQRRGGYCYEVNELFGHLLQQLGFTVRRVSARLASGHKYGKPFEHLALLVTLEDKNWLVDVGYGDFALTPLQLTAGLVQHDGCTSYLLTPGIQVDGVEHWQVAKWSHSKQAFATDYIFTTHACALEDFEQMNAWKQSSGESKFRRSLICSIPTATGRISMVGNRLIFTHNGEKHVHIIPNEISKRLLLLEHFGIQFPVDEYAKQKITGSAMV